VLRGLCKKIPGAWVLNFDITTKMPRRKKKKYKNLETLRDKKPKISLQKAGENTQESLDLPVN
jgi:hypothetical protein